MNSPSGVAGWVRATAGSGPVDHVEKLPSGRCVHARSIDDGEAHPVEGHVRHRGRGRCGLAAGQMDAVSPTGGPRWRCRSAAPLRCGSTCTRGRGLARRHGIEKATRDRRSRRGSARGAGGASWRAGLSVHASWTDSGGGSCSRSRYRIDRRRAEPTPRSCIAPRSASRRCLCSEVQSSGRHTAVAAATGSRSPPRLHADQSIRNQSTRGTDGRPTRWIRIESPGAALRGPRRETSGP